MIDEKLKILYCKDWHNNINKSDAKLRNYALYKTTFNRENYLLYIKDKKFRSSLTKLRISSHKLLIETGRHNKPCKIPADERFCTFCNDSSIEDERHLVLTCKLYQNERETFFRQLNCNIINNDILSNLMFMFLMSASESDLSNLFSRYIYKCFKKRDENQHK